TLPQRFAACTLEAIRDGVTQHLHTAQLVQHTQALSRKGGRLRELQGPLERRGGDVEIATASAEPKHLERLTVDIVTTRFAGDPTGVRRQVFGSQQGSRLTASEGHVGLQYGGLRGDGQV